MQEISKIIAISHNGLFSLSQALLSGNKNSFHCSCSSLGKRVIHYDDGGGSGDEASGKKRSCPPLSIPESLLTWKHRRSPGGTQMIVFRASQFIEEDMSVMEGNEQRNCRKNCSQHIKGTIINELFFST